MSKDESKKKSIKKMIHRIKRLESRWLNFTNSPNEI
jgi:hypothetical protein